MLFGFLVYRIINFVQISVKDVRCIISYLICIIFFRFLFIQFRALVQLSSKSERMLDCVCYNYLVSEIFLRYQICIFEDYICFKFQEVFEQVVCFKMG